ncbi:putative ATP-dependent RNA helicase DDX46 isoform X3 [Convolutriloba macropyga]|uniref:putative ATP-dependent RNA helicase DDX46 isoform X3 n=1 Tax=Convolutriloba macropyga TaxID=536237 RepID=UPI003F5205D4
MPETSKKRHYRGHSSSESDDSPDRKRKKKRTEKDRKPEKDRKSRRSRSRSAEIKSSNSSNKDSRNGDVKVKKRSRSREKERSRERKRSRKDEKSSKNSSSSTDKVAQILSSGKSQEDIQKDLELEMQKRRDKVAKWRSTNKDASSATTSATAGAGTPTDAVKANGDDSAAAINQSWSLENDDDDANSDEGNNDTKKVDESARVNGVKQEAVTTEVKKEEPKEEEEEIDPLDEFMMEIDKAVKPKSSNSVTVKNSAVSNGSSRDSATNGDAIDPSKPSVKKMVVVKKTVVSAAALFSSSKSSASASGGALATASGSGSRGVATGMSKEVSEVEKKRGVLIEQGQDALEYSSEEEDKLTLGDLNAATDHKRLKLVQVDHSKIEYPPFNKNFYVEVPEIARMNKTEVAKYRENDLDGTKVKGANCPKPVKSWVQTGVSKAVLSVLKKNKYEAPTPIQAQALPVIMSGRDMLGIAQTGCGKTLAFLIPMFRHVLDQPFLEEGDGPIAVLMTPTRELALQTFKECKKFTKPLGIRVVCVYGGTGISEQIAELKVGCEIIVCTPGRMIDMLAANSGRVTNLRRCTYCVLDEADRMFDMGFEPQVMRIMDNMRPDRQTVMFSATFPRQMETLARRILDNPIEITVGGRSVVCPDVEQNVVIMDDEDIKFYKLLELLGLFSEMGSSLVFVERQEDADKLLKRLMDASYSCLALHGGLDQYDRDSVISDFRMGVCTLLIATSVAARGLDVRSLYLVVNYDCPSHYEDYVHRCGRTGRAGNKGVAYTFITTDQGRLAGDVLKAFQLSKVEVPQALQELWDEYVAEQKAQGKEVYRTGGFGGKGFKFDDTEREMDAERKKLQKISHGMGESDDEDDQIIESKIEQMFDTKKSVKTVEPSAEEKAALAEQYRLAEQAQKTLDAPVIFTGNQNIDNKMKQARELALKMLKNPQHASKFAAEMTNAIHRPPNAQSQQASKDKSFMDAANAFLRTGTFSTGSNSKSAAEQAAEKLNRKLNYQRTMDTSSSHQMEVDAHMMTKYEEELEINDFPATARFKVLSRETLTHLAEYSDCMITVKGQYYPPGHNPPEGERKLFLAIESIHERGVAICKAELVRIIKEELIRLQSSQGTRQQGRYKVV